MNLNIKENIISKIKNDNEEEIINIINESVSSTNELVLPGLGVLMGLFWNDLSYEEKQNIAKKITVHV